MERKLQKEIDKLVAEDRGNNYEAADIFPDKISLEKLKPIWNDEHAKYTDEQLFKIREWLYAICNIALSVAEKHFENRNQIIELKPKMHEAEESSSIHSRKYRRAS